jgi:site-specific DNA recombinase
MANVEFFKDAFDQIAVNGCIGSPSGKPAYCYLRVSSTDQADEGRSGLPRQMLNCHEAALRHGYKIPWELIFADDSSGFEFRERPAFTKLRDEARRADRRANVLIIEYLDRLSRNADWHQGFLLDEMKERNLQVVFWKQFNSRIERAVMGAISQEGMEQSKQRMMEGNLMKARSGRITARTPAYGYCLVDSMGTTTGAKTDTHYAVREDQAHVVRIIFDRIGCEGYSLRGMATWLDGHFPPLGKAAFWSARQVELIIQNPLYKGEFAAHRWDYKRIKATNQKSFEPERMAWRKIERPQSEWIIVPAPAIVPPDLWKLANEMLPKNKQTAKRNGKQDYLLTGLAKCAECESAFVARRKTTIKPSGKRYFSSSYKCTSRDCASGRAKRSTCSQRQITTKIIEPAVWNVVAQVLLRPEIVINALEESFASGANQQLFQKIEFLEKEITDTRDEDERLYRAYMAKVFDENEFAARRHGLKERIKNLEGERTRLRTKIVTREKIDAAKAKVLAICATHRSKVEEIDPPFELKKAIVRLVVDQIKVNTREGWFDLEGAFRGRYPMDGPIVYTPADRD